MSRGEGVRRAARGKCEVLRRAVRGAGQGGAAPLGAARLTPRDIWGQKMGAGA